MLKTKAPPIHIKLPGPEPGPVITDRSPERGSPKKAAQPISEPTLLRDDDAAGTLNALDSPAFRHPTGLPSRVAFLTEIQQLRGNAYVQQLIQNNGAGQPAEVEERSPQSIDSTADVDASTANPVTPGPPAVMRRVAGPPEPRPESGERAEESAAETGAAARAAPEEEPEIGTYRSGIKRAVDRVPAPRLESAAGGPSRIQKTSGEMTAARVAGRGGARKDVQKVVPPPPPVKHQVPVEDEPVPDAARLVSNASDKLLPDQTMPALDKTLLGTQPVLGTKPLPPPKPEDAKPPTAAPPPDKVEAKEKDQKQAKNAKEDASKQPDEASKKEGAAKPLEPLTLKDEPIKPQPPLPKALATDVGKVMAHLLAQKPLEAENILKETRKSAFPRGELERQFPEIGKEWLGEIEQNLDRQLRQIADAAGVGKEELDKKIAERQQQIEEQKKKAAGETAAAGAQGKAAVKKSGEQDLKANAAAKAKQEEIIDMKRLAVKGELDPAAVEKLREAQLKRIRDQVGQQTVNYTTALKRREQQLDRAEYLALAALRRADQIDQATIQEALKSDPQKYDSLQSGRNLKWLNDQIGKVQEQIRSFKKASGLATEGYQKDLLSASFEGQKLVRAWADEKLKVKRSWWQDLIQQFDDWAAQARATTEAWETQRNQETRDDVAIDLVTLNDTIAAVGEDVNLESLDQRRDLTAEQKAIIKAYLTPGPDKKDPISAVAAGMRVRVQRQVQPDITSRMEKKVLEEPDEQWRKLNALCAAQGRDIAPLSHSLWNAMDQWGTDEDAVYNALAGLTPFQSAVLRKAYKAMWGKDLQKHIESEFSGKEETRAIALLEGKKATAEAAALKEAFGLVNTDEEAVYKALRGKTAEEREAIAAEYKRMYGKDLNAALAANMDKGHELDRANALMAGKTALADAIGVDETMRGGLGIRTDLDAMEAIYKQIRKEVAEAHPDWTSAQVEAEVSRRNAEVEVEFNTKYATDYGSPEGSALRKALDKNIWSDDRRDLANALADNDLIAADAARIRIEAKGVYTSDDTVNTILQSQYERAVDAARRDWLPQKRKELQERIEKRRQDGKPMTQDEITAANRQIERDLEEHAKAGGLANMKALEQKFDSKYKDWYGSDGKFEYGGLQSVIQMNMSGEDQKKAKDLVTQGGYLSPAQQIWYAVEQMGTDEDALKKALKGRTKEEIAKIREEWAKLPQVKKAKVEDMDSRIREELDGRDLFDVNDMLVHGEPENARERMEHTKRRYDYETTAYGAAGGMAKEELKVLKEEYQESKKRYDKLISGEKLPIEDRNRLQEEFELQAGHSQLAADTYRQGVDRVTDQVVNLVVTAVTVIVAVALAIASGGTATAGSVALIALVTSLWGTAATVITKSIMLGSAYGLEDYATDLALGAVDAAVSVATAGVGDKLLKAARTIPKGVIMQIAKSTSKMAKAAAWVVTEGIENALQVAPNTLAQNVFNDKNWQGDPLKNILKGTINQLPANLGMAAAMMPVGYGASKLLAPVMKATGRVLADAAGSFSKFRGAKVDAPDAPGFNVHPSNTAPEGKVKSADTELPPPELRPAEPGKRITNPSTDPHADLGTPAERQAGWLEYRQKNPAAEHGDYLQGLSDGTIPRASPEAAAKVEQAMREQVMKGIPETQRPLFKDVPIEVVSDAEFAAFTRSQAKGQAVVIFENGRPRIIVRETAEVHFLRGEGVHLAQSLDPRTAGKIHLLDEARLAAWDQLSVSEKLDLYRTKIELEIDGQRRLMQGLSDDLARAAGNADLVDALGRQLKEARETLDNLSRRLAEVDAVRPEQRIEMNKGIAEPPPYLDEPARLFGKKSDQKPTLKERAEKRIEDQGELRKTTAAREAYREAQRGGYAGKHSEDDFVTMYRAGYEYDSKRGWIDVTEGRQPPKRFDDNATPAKVFEVLAGKKSESTFKSYFEALEAEGIANRKDVIDLLKKLDKGLGGLGGRTHDDVRGKLKDSFEKDLLAKMVSPDGAEMKKRYKHLDWADNPVDAMREAKYLEMLRITRELDPADKGNLAEAWYAATHKNGVQHVALNQEAMRKAGINLDADRVADRVEGSTLRELKHVADKLAARDLEQFADFMKLVGRRKGATQIDVSGKRRTITDVSYTFLDPNGAAANAAWMAQQLRKYPDKLSFVIYNEKGQRRVLKFDGSDMSDLSFLESGRYKKWLEGK